MPFGLGPWLGLAGLNGIPGGKHVNQIFAAGGVV